MKTSFQDVLAEKEYQDMLWGVQDYTPERWLTILGEEFGGACKEIVNRRGGVRNTLYRDRVVRIAATAVIMLESYDRREKDRLLKRG